VPQTETWVCRNSEANRRSLALLIGWEAQIFNNHIPADDSRRSTRALLYCLVALYRY
jgi:hypothetical protein